MADIAITATNVLPRGGATIAEAAAGATITAGQAVYLEAATGTLKLADANSATAEVRSPKGLALNGAAAGQPVKYQTAGPLTCGGTLTAGTAYYLSNTPGGICPVADVTGTGTYPTILGIATSTTVLDIKIHESGVAL